MNPSQMADTGKIINGFAIKQMIGQGSMGRVYQVVKEERSFALKEISKKYLEEYEALDALDIELNILKLLQDKPNIVQLVQHFQTQDFYYLVLEYCSNQSLLNFINTQQEKRLPEKLAVGYFRQILNGYQALHEQKIIHRDVSVRNILVDKEIIVKISDFGCSKVLKDQQTQTYKGAIGAIAPEVLRGEKYSYLADVFSLGSVFYYMLYGYYPFQGRNQIEYQKSLINNLKFDPKIQVSDKVKQILTKMLEKDQYDRISFAEIYNDELIQYRDIFIPTIQPHDLVQGLLDNEHIRHNKQFYINNEPAPVDEQQIMETLSEISLVNFDDSKLVSEIQNAKPEQLVISDKGKEIIKDAFYQLQIAIYIWNTYQELEQLNFKNEKKIVLQREILKYAQQILMISINCLNAELNLQRTVDIALILVDETYEQTSRQLNELSNHIANQQQRLGDNVQNPQTMQQIDLQTYIDSYAHELKDNLSEVATNRKMQIQILIHLGTILKFQYQIFEFNLEEDFLGLSTYSEDVLRQRHKQIFGE